MVYLSPPLKEYLESLRKNGNDDELDESSMQINNLIILLFSSTVNQNDGTILLHC